MAAALKLSVEERVHDLEREARAEHARAHGEDVRIVVAAGHLGGVAGAAQGGAEALDLVGGDGDADAGAADEDAALVLPARDGAGHGLAVDGVVAALFAVRAEVLVGKAQLVEMAHDLLLEGKTAVVTSDRNHKQYLDFCNFPGVKTASPGAI